MTAPHLYIAAKPPVPGRVKTRLARTIGAVASAELYAAFLEDVAAMVRDAGIPAGWFIPPATGWIPPSLGGAQVATRWQRGDTWGARQSRLFAEVMGERPGPVALIASDSPQLDRDDLAAAFAALESVDVVLGPVLDGGYYLLGMAGWYDVIGTVEMSTGTVTGELVARAAALGLSTHLLPARFDVDEAADLQLLAASTAAHLRATRSWLDSNAAVSLA